MLAHGDVVARRVLLAHWDVVARIEDVVAWRRFGGSCSSVDSWRCGGSLKMSWLT